MSTALGPGSDVRRRELAAFLRSRRERLTPAQVGLPDDGRRRTPSLRREEVAQLAGVGVTWYTWLEQGRDINASSQVVHAISRTLRLDAHEHAHLLTLAGIPARPQLDRGAIAPSVRAMLDQLEPLPVSIGNGRYDLLDYNRGYQWLMGDVDGIAPEDRNILLQSFTNPDWRSRMADRETKLRRLVARFRAQFAEHAADPDWQQLLTRLRSESAEFETLWNEHQVVTESMRTKRFWHPDAGMLCFTIDHLYLDRHSDICLSVCSPADPDTAAKLSL